MEKAEGTCDAAAVVTTTALAVGFFSSLADVDPDISNAIISLRSCSASYCCNTSDYEKSNL